MRCDCVRLSFKLTFLLFYQSGLLILVVLGQTNLWLAILADTGAMLIVIATALRLLCEQKISFNGEST
jgi:cation transport ATPase